MYQAAFDVGYYSSRRFSFLFFFLISSLRLGVVFFRKVGKSGYLASLSVFSRLNFVIGKV